MEGQRNDENPHQLISFAFDGNARDTPYSPGNDPSKLYIMEGGGNQTHSIPLSLPHWVPCQQTPFSFVKLLTESGVSEVESSRASRNYSGMLYNSEHPHFSLEMNKQKVRYLRPHNEVGPMNLTSAESGIHIQTQESSQDYCNFVHPHLSIAVGAPRLPPKKSSKVARQKATASDRRRRLRIAQKLDALQELLPHSPEGSQASVMDDIIDHIKHLQLQIKNQVELVPGAPFHLQVFPELFEIFDNWLPIQNYLIVDRGNHNPDLWIVDLSKSTLAGESTSAPFIALEGYGHYLFDEQMLGEPLEEALGRLLEMNPSAVFKLLESRGLYMMPAVLDEGFRQTT